MTVLIVFCSLVGLLSLLILRSTAKLDKEIVNLTQFEELLKAKQELVDRCTTLGRHVQSKGIDINCIDSQTSEYIYLCGKLDGVFEALEISEKIAKQLIF